MLVGKKKKKEMLVEHVFCLKYNDEQDNIVYGLGLVL